MLGVVGGEGGAPGGGGSGVPGEGGGLSPDLLSLLESPTSSSPSRRVKLKSIIFNPQFRRADHEVS